MYYQLETLIKYNLITEDNHHAGYIDSILFDEGIFGVQYAVVRTDDWLPGRLILLSPAVLGKPDFKEKQIPVSCTRTMIESSPSIETHAPVSLKQKYDLAKHYGWPIRWSGASGTVPGIMTPPNLPAEPAESENSAWQSNPENFPLRRTSEVEGYYVSVEGSQAGTVSGFIIEEPAWMMRYFIVKEGTLKPVYRLVLCASVKKIDFDQSTLFLSVTQKQYDTNPVFIQETPVSEKQEKMMRDFIEEHMQ